MKVYIVLDEYLENILAVYDNEIEAIRHSFAVEGNIRVMKMKKKYRGAK
jgi:hypothetical protein